MSDVILMSPEIPDGYTIMHQKYLLNNISSTNHNQLEKQSIDKQKSIIYVFDMLEATIGKSGKFVKTMPDNYYPK